jgi:hypothetical protein
MNRTSIPPTNTINKIYWNQNLRCINPLIRHIIIVCVSIIPMASGWIICVNIALNVILSVVMILISGNSWFEMLTMEVDDRCWPFPWSFKRLCLFLVYKTNIFVELLKLLMLTRLFFLFAFFCGVWSFSCKRKHLLAILLRLEFVVLVFFLLFTFICVYINMSFIFL